MPLSRYQIRNEYSLADPELYRAADKDDPEALLEGVAMAGLVGVLRQLGDLAEFAAEIFHNLHEEVMATAARGHGLMVRVQQLEAEFPAIEKAFLSQTNHSAFFCNTGIDWHPNLQKNQNLITRGDLPRFIMDSYEECRGPPRLFLLDKFDIAGAGACLKRYTDPSFFKVESSSYEMTSAAVQREKKTRKVKKKGSRWRNGETPEVLPTAKAKLHQLFLEERVANGVSDPARLVKLKRRLNGFPFHSNTGKSYMEKFLKTTSPEDKMVHEISVGSPPSKLPSNINSESGFEILEISKPNPNFEAGNIPSTLPNMVDEKEIAVDGGSKSDGSVEDYQSDEIASEVDNYMDALATMESEIETDTEFRIKNDLGFLNIEKQGTDSDANEEQLQAQFSDSQSIANSTASDDGNSSSKKGISSFCCSDTGSTSAENTPLDGDTRANVFPSTESCVAEITDISSDQVYFIEEVPVVSNGVCIEVAEIPSYRSESGEPSSISCITESAPMLLPANRGEILTEGTFGGPELDEISSNHNELDSGFINIEENGTNLDDNLPFMPKHSDVPLKTSDDFPHTMVDKLDDEDPNVFSNASIHFSNSLAATLEKESSESLFDSVLQTEYAEDKSSSPHSVISNAEEQPFVPALLDLETCSSDIKPDGIISVDDAIPSTGKIAVNSTPAIDSPNTPNFVQVSKITDVVPLLDLDSTEVGISYFGEKNLDVALSTADGEEMGGITSNTNLVGSDATTLELPSDFSNHPDPSLISEVNVHLDEKETETVQSETVVMAMVVIDNDANKDDVNSPSANFGKLEEECLSSFEESNQNELEISKVCLPMNCKESEAQKEVNQQAVASPDSDSVLGNTASHDHSESELLNDATSVPSYSKQSGQESESESSHQSNLIENMKDALSSPTCSFAEPRTHFEQKIEVHDDQLDMERSELCVPLENTQSSNHMAHETDTNAYSESCPVHLPRQPLEQKVEFQADQLDVESLQVGESCIESSSHLEQIQSRSIMDHERLLVASSESCSTHLPSEASVSEKATAPLCSGFPVFDLLPEVSQINLEEMPPLPPLPPVQWRIGKLQHSSMASEKAASQHNVDHFPPMFPSKAEEKIQMGYSAFEGDTMQQPSNPFSSHSAVKYENSEHVDEHLVGSMVNSSPFSLPMPTISNHRNSRDDFNTLDGTQSMNPFLTLPATYNETPQHIGSAEMMHPSFNAFSPETIFGDTPSTHTSGIQSLHQLPPEPSLENEKLEQSSMILEAKVANPSDTIVQPPTIEHANVPETSEAEILWSSSTSLPPDVEDDGKTIQNRPMKLPRPRSPLIDAVAAHDKSKLRKVTERVRPPIEKVEERDSLLEQIRTKSFNLKPAVATRPSIRGPKTNLKVAAILEKANSIRQALAGSDEDDDTDWSDS